MDMELKVECYSGYRAEERPLRFVFSGRVDVTQYEVKEVLDQWYGAGYRCFKVLASDGHIYILRHQESEDGWRLDAFRRAECASPRSEVRGRKSRT
jgi:hypothetical protein